MPVSSTVGDDWDMDDESRMSQPLGVLAVCGAWRAILVRPGVHGRTCLPRQEVPVLQPPEDRFERVFLE